MTDSTLHEISEILQKSSSFVVVSHVAPDPDAIGSSGALTQILRERGKKVTWYLQDQVPANFQPLLHQGPPQRSVPTGDKHDLLVIVDTATRARVGRDIKALEDCCKKSINIDHHVSNECWCDWNFVDATAASTAEIILTLSRELKHNLNSQTANLLYAGVMDDTGSFRYSNTSPRTFESAAYLLSQGANASEVANALYFSIPEKVLKLRALCTTTLQSHYSGQFTLLYCTNKMLESTGCLPEDTDSMIDIARSIAGVKACAFIREMESDYKISLRTKTPEIDVNKLAQQFGGGGHKAAAGCRISGSQDAVIATIIEAFRPLFPNNS